MKKNSVSSKNTLKSNLKTKPKTNNINVIKTNVETTQILVDFVLNVVFQDKKYKINCSDGKQKLTWLMDLVVHKYDSNFAFESGI